MVLMSHRKWARTVEREREAGAKARGQRLWGLGKGRSQGEQEGMRLVCSDRSHNLLHLGQTLLPGQQGAIEDNNLQLTCSVSQPDWRLPKAGAVGLMGL